MRANDWIQLGALVVSSFALRYLIKYVRYTKTISEHSIRQTEASFKPAIVVVHDRHIDHQPRLRNVGNGTALGVKWHLLNSEERGAVSHLEAGADSESLPFAEGMKPLYLAAGDHPTATILTTYCSISGQEYVSTSVYEVNVDRFITTVG